MNTELQDKIVALITQLESGVEFAKGQAPVIVEQLFTYDAAVAIFWLMAGLLFLLPGAIAKYKWSTLKGSLSGEPLATTVLVLLVTTLIGVAMIADNISILTKIYIAPNLYVLDYLKGII